MNDQTEARLAALVLLALTAFSILALASLAISGPVVGQATPGTPAGNATNNSSNSTGTPYPVETLAPDRNGLAGNASASASGSNESTSTTAAPGAPGVPRAPGAGTGSGTGTRNGSGIDLGVPSADDLAGQAVNSTLGRLNRVFVGTWGSILKFPWRLITVRFAPFDAVTSVGEGDDGLWQRPPGVYGQLYDLATGWAFEFAVSVLVIFLLVDWLGNLSPRPGTVGPIDRLFFRGGDITHLLFSWPIAWAHFLLSTIFCVIFLPPDEVVVGGLTDLWSQFAGVASLIGFTLVFSVVIAIAGGYLLLKHAGAFIYLLVGIVAYPLSVAASIPDHPVVGRLGAFAENAREGYVVSAWYPTPTAFVLGVGYTIDQAVLSALTLGRPLGEVGGGGLYYPVLWLAALYAPEKVFNDGGVPHRLRDGLLAAGAGGAAGAAAGGSTGAADRITLQSGIGASGAAGAAASQSLPATTSAAETSMSAASSTASRMRSGSPGAKALADGGTTTTSASGGGGGAGPFGGSSSTSTGPGAGVGSAGTQTGPGSSRSGPATGSATTAQEPDGLNRVADRANLDTEQRYEPLVQHDSGKIARVSTPKDANWLADQGGVENLDRGTDEPLYFRGERDGELYDLRGAAESAGVHGGDHSTGGGAGSTATETGENDVRGT